MNPSPATSNSQHKPIQIFMIVSSAILISEAVAILAINGIRDPWEEILEVLLLTALISAMIYLLLIRPMIAEISLRRAAETELRNERDRLEQLTGAIGAGLAVIDRNYQVVWTNRVMSQSFRSSPGAYCYNSFKHSNSGPCYDCGVREVFEAGREQCTSEHRLIDAQGCSGWFQVIVTPLKGQDGAIESALELIVPIDTRKTIEEALVHSQMRFQSLVESSVDWIWEVDSAGRYTYAGPQCRHLLGYDPEEIIGMTPFMLMPEDERGRVSSFFIQTAASRQPFCLLENSLIHKDGRLVVMETSGAPFFDSDGTFSGYRGIDRDISDRKALEALQQSYQEKLEQQVYEQTIKLQLLLAEQSQSFFELQSVESSLRQSELRFRQVFEHTKDAIILIDWQTGTILDANPTARDMFECRYDSLPGRSWADLQVRDESNAPLKLHDIGSHGEFMLMRGEVTTFTGRVLIISIWGKLLQLEGSQTVYCSLRDITDKIRLEKEAQEIQTKLIQTNKMTSLGFLVSGIAHEINNPNNNILLSAQLLNNTWQDVVPILDRRFDEEGDYILAGDFYSEVRQSIPKYFNMITDGSRRIEIIINNLRDFTIKSKSELTQEVDVNRIASISASILQHQIKKHTRNFTLSLSPVPLTIKGNQQQLEQVLVNLIVNAIQSLSSIDRAVRLTTGYDASQQSVIVTVSDEGCGIQPEHLPYVFDPFFSTKLESGGTGLGLAISSNIIKEHGGRLEIKSAAGIGTTAVIILTPLDSSLMEEKR
ncbi:MAG: PAS domain S-box protein [Geobacteraceae bacterium]|nr:PAS domain S-box protein [Geobacteraceae bacterium]